MIKLPHEYASRLLERDCRERPLRSRPTYPRFLRTGPINIPNTRSPFRNRSTRENPAAGKLREAPNRLQSVKLPGDIGEIRAHDDTTRNGERQTDRERERGKERRTRGTERQTERRDVHIRVERGETLIPSCVSLRLNYVTKFQQSVEGRAKLWSGTRWGNDDY